MEEMGFISTSPIARPTTKTRTSRQCSVEMKKGSQNYSRAPSRRAFLISAAGFAASITSTVFADSPESAVSINDLTIGDGETFYKGDLIKMHYTLTLNGFQEDGGKIVDSSRLRRKPFSYTYDSGLVIKGWDMGVKGMRVGGHRRVVVPPELGYGPRGVGSIIPPNAVLYFDIELLGVGYK